MQPYWQQYGLTFFILLTFFLLACQQGQVESEPQVTVVKKDAEQKVDVLIEGKLFTSYLYGVGVPDLKKPVLYPLVSSGGNAVTRGYPLVKRAGERTDHPHHVGAWFNYGNVNGLDFWNNSDDWPEERANEMGTIRHKAIESTISGEGKGELNATSEWLTPDGDVLLEEATHFVFKAGNKMRAFERTTTLTAQDKQVTFTDNKEGMFGIRVTRALEHPSDEPATFTDASGNPTEVKVMSNEGVTGSYLTSEGVDGEDAWGTRGRWVTLRGVVNGEAAALTIFDHPNNVGFPTYWHARGYGLFAANPLGQKIFSEGKNELNFALQPGESTTFRYRVSIRSGKPSVKELEDEYQTFASPVQR